jgi:solute carrier family 25 (adenine nucleotide translocator) protein 4/5/6/31
MRYVPSIGLNFYFRSLFKTLFKVETYKKTKSKYFIYSTLAGGCAGVTTEFIVYPLDFTRTRLAVDVLLGKHER